MKLIDRMRTLPPASITDDDVKDMLLDMKMSLVAISVSFGEDFSPDNNSHELRIPFENGYAAAGLNDAICITDDDDHPDLPVAQILRPVYLRMCAVESALRAVNTALQERQRHDKLIFPIT